MANLATLAQLKLCFSITDRGSDTLLNQALSDASAWIVSHTRMNHVAARYREHRCGTGRMNLWLKQRPIQRILSIRGPMTISAIQVKYTGAANMATLTVVDDTRLELITSIAGTLSTTQIPFSTYNTLTLLHNQIETVSGWEAAIETDNQDCQESCELLPVQNANCRNEFVSLETTDTPIDGFYFLEKGMVVRVATTWWPGQRNYSFRYEAGYGTIGDTEANRIDALPADLQLAAVELAKMLYLGRGDDPDIRSEHLSSYSYTKAGSGERNLGGMPLRIERLLSSYIRPEIDD